MNRRASSGRASASSYRRRFNVLAHGRVMTPIGKDAYHAPCRRMDDPSGIKARGKTGMGEGAGHPDMTP